MTESTQGGHEPQPFMRSLRCWPFAVAGLSVGGVLLACGARTGLLDGSSGTENPVPTEEAGVAEDASVTSQSIGCPAPSGVQAGAPWPMSMRCPTRTGWTPVLGPATAPRVRWEFLLPDTQLGATGNASPVIAADGTIYVAMEDNPLYALDSQGTVLWSSPLACSHSSPAIGADGTIYVGDDSATLHALDPTGREKWSYLSPPVFPTNQTFPSGSPALGADGTVYFGNGIRLHALAPSGGLLWSVVLETAFAGGASPAIAGNGDVYAQNGVFNTSLNAQQLPSGLVSALSRTGNFLWPTAFDGGTPSGTAAPVTVAPKGTVVASAFWSVGTLPPGYSGAAGVEALALDGGTLWYFDLPVEDGGPFSQFPLPVAVAPGGFVYVANARSLVAFTPAGSVLWQTALAGEATSAPIVDGAGIIYVGTASNLVAVSPAGAVLWSLGAVSGATSLAIGGDGTLYAGTGTEGLYALR